MVARAAPSTPMPSPAMKAMTSTTLSTQEIARKTSGVRLSPSARMVLERKLKNMVAAMPQNETTMNR